MKKNDEKNNSSLGRASDSIETFKIHLLEDKIEPFEKVPWLKAALGEDENLLICQNRRIYAELFIQTILYPQLDQEAELDEIQLADLLSIYRKSLTGPGKDFEISNVVGSILNR